MHTTRGDGVTSIKRRRRNLTSDGVRKMTMGSGLLDSCYEVKRLSGTYRYSASNRAYRSEGTQDVSSNPAGFQDDDSDSGSDEQVILVPSYLSNNIPGVETKDSSDAHSNGVLFDTAEDIFQQELARLKDQEQRATYDTERLGLGFANDAEELQKRASAKTVPPGSIPVPTDSIPVPTGDTMVL
ncbi:hypothetical protein Tco_1174921 [Tanacetum coccineum]